MYSSGFIGSIDMDEQLQWTY